MADLNYDFSMNKFKNRLETFKDWPFTEETGSSCTARKVRQICRFSDFETSVFKSEVCFRTSSVHGSQSLPTVNFDSLIFPTKLFFLVRWQKQDSFILPTIVILTLCAVLFVSRNLKDGNLKTILCTQELYEIYSHLDSKQKLIAPLRVTTWLVSATRSGTGRWGQVGMSQTYQPEKIKS